MGADPAARRRHQGEQLGEHRAAWLPPTTDAWRADRYESHGGL